MGVGWARGVYRKRPHRSAHALRIFSVDRFRAVPRAAWIILAVALVIAAIGGLLLVGGTASPAASLPAATGSPTQAPSPTPSPTTSPTPSPDRHADPCPLPAERSRRSPHCRPAGIPALIVQIENHPLARPTRNLTNADIVIEATVEGDVTRFSAVFYCQPTVGLTGPIRSARYYNIDLWQEIHGADRAFRSQRPRPRAVRGGGDAVDRTESPAPGRISVASEAPRQPHNLYGDLEAIARSHTRRTRRPRPSSGEPARCDHRSPLMTRQRSRTDRASAR